MSTALDLIKEAGKEIGVFSEGLTPSTEQANDALVKLNRVIDDFNTQGLALFNTTNVVATLTGGKNPHTLGIDGDINIDRPLKIQRAFVRNATVTNPVDYPLEQVDNDQYQEIVLKGVKTTYPTKFYFDNSYPLANFFTYPVQSTNLELHLSVWSKLTKFELTTIVSLPEGYEEALMLKLAIKMAPSYGIRGAILDDTKAEYARIMRNLKAINQDSNHMTLDSALVNGGNKSINIFRGF